MRDRYRKRLLATILLALGTLAGEMFWWDSPQWTVPMLCVWPVFSMLLASRLYQASTLIEWYQGLTKRESDKLNGDGS